MDMLKDKEEILKFLLHTIESNEKVSAGLRNTTQMTDGYKISKLIEVVANQSIQIRKLSMLLLVYSQSNTFNVDIATMLNKMGRGQEAMQQMFKNKLDGK